MTKSIALFTKNRLFVLLFLTCLAWMSPSYAKRYIAHDINGHTIHFSIPSNKWIIINYWATWCGACVEEIPELNKLATTLRDKPAVFLAVNFEGLPSDQLRTFASQFGMAFPITRLNPINNLIDPEGFSSIPVTVVISPQGRINILRGEQSVNDILQVMA